jgi:biotin operon repressor
MTDTQKTLKVLRLAGEKGIHSFDLGREIGTIRISARIYDLKKKGYAIDARPEKRGDAVGVRYTLIEKRPKYEFDPIRQIYYQTA